MLEELGVVVTTRIPCIVKAQELNMGYLATKQVCILALLCLVRSSAQHHADTKMRRATGVAGEITASTLAPLSYQYPLVYMYQHFD